jgi:hypothetical protein
MNKQILIKLRNNFLAPGGLLEILPWADYILMKILSLLTDWFITVQIIIPILLSGIFHEVSHLLYSHMWLLVLHIEIRKFNLRWLIIPPIIKDAKNFLPLIINENFIFINKNIKPTHEKKEIILILKFLQENVQKDMKLCLQIDDGIDNFLHLFLAQNL